MPFPKPRGIAAFFIGLLLVVAALLLIAVRQRSRQHAQAAPPPPPAGTLLLGPRSADEPEPTLTFEPQGKKSGSEGAFYVLGMVKNQSPFPVDKPRVVASLLGSTGEELARHEGYAERDRLGPGESSPLKVLISEPPRHERIAYTASARRALYDPGKVPNLRVEQEGDPKPNFATWEIGGRVKNEGPVAASLVKVELVIRNAAGAMIGVESAFAETDRLEPGRSARFAANLMLDEEPAKVELAVSALPAK